MAIIILGSSECALCRKVLADSSNVTGLPPSPQTDHPLHKYFDAGFHKDCFENWDQKDEIIRLIKEDKRNFVNSDHFKEMEAKYGRPKWADDLE